MTRAAAMTRAAPAPEQAVPALEEAVRTRDLTKTYPGGVIAVDQLDLSVRRGEVFGLLGPNGAGKTTTVGMLTTRIVPTSGTALLHGIDVAARPALARQVIGVVPQANTLDRSLSVRDNLSFHGRYFGMSRRTARVAADEALVRFRLTGRAGAGVHTLSGGMARRLMVARAVLHRPAVVFLDEPTAGLDPQSRLALWEIIDELHQVGQTVVLTTHHMEEADHLCDRVAIMDRGRILALDSPDRLKRSLGAGAVVRVKADGDLDALASHLARLPGASEARRIDGDVRLHLVQGHAALLRVVDAAERGGFRLTDVSVSETTLETVFIALTGKDLRE